MRVDPPTRRRAASNDVAKAKEEIPVDYAAKLDEALNRLHDEGRYRTFIDIERKKGQFPHATWRKADGSEQPITVWCGNDYLGMGQHPAVLGAMHEAIDNGKWCAAARSYARDRQQCMVGRNRLLAAGKK